MKYGIWCVVPGNDLRKANVRGQTGWVHDWQNQNLEFESEQAAASWLENAFKHDDVTYTVKAL